MHDLSIAGARTSRMRVPLLSMYGNMHSDVYQAW
jgi:hypothetical protein